MFKYHCIAFFIGFILDLIIGDPYSFPHPVRAIGKLISALERFLYKDNEDEIENRNEWGKSNRLRGILTLLLVIIITFLVTLILLSVSYRLNPILGLIMESIMTYQILATKCLKDESMKVYDKLKNGTIEEARLAVSMIVGRDTDKLTDIQVAKACVETIAENTSDGVIAPMIYTAIGGPVLGFIYKAINTCDSMIGYKNERYIDFGRAAAKLDDCVNFLPARISALIMILGSFLLGKDFNGRRAFIIFKRDRFNHASPNSAQTESVMAGGLGILLAGDTSYFGKMVKKPFIGDMTREIEIEDIKRANRLLYFTAFFAEAMCLIVMFL